MGRRRREHLKHGKDIQEFLDLLQEAMGTIEPKQNDELVKKIERKINEYQNRKNEIVENDGNLRDV